MARITDDKAKQTLTPHLQSGEELKNWAFGIKQPPILLLILFALFGGIPAIIAIAILTKNYLVGLTNRRFIVLRFTGVLKIKEVSEYTLGQIPAVKTKTGSLFTKIEIQDPSHPFKAKFHRLGMKENRTHSIAIAQGLEQGSVKAL